MSAQPDLDTPEIYIVTDPSNPEWDIFVRMTLTESDRAWDAGYKAELFAQPAHPGDITEFKDFAKEWLND